MVHLNEFYKKENIQSYEYFMTVCLYRDIFIVLIIKKITILKMQKVYTG